MKYLIVLLFPAMIFAQKTKIKPDTVCFTREQAADISFVLDSLWAADDINNMLIAEYRTLTQHQDTLIVLDSMQLQNKTNEIVLLNEQLANYKIKVDLLQPKLLDKKSIWFSFGFLAALGSGILINQLTK